MNVSTNRSFDLLTTGWLLSGMAYLRRLHTAVFDLRRRLRDRNGVGGSFDMVFLEVGRDNVNNLRNVSKILKKVSCHPPHEKAQFLVRYLQLGHAYPL